MRKISVFCLVICLAFMFADAQEGKPGPDGSRDKLEVRTDIDRFMEKVLERRQTNWADLMNYVFSETEVLEFHGSIDLPALQSFRREYVWYVRDNGYIVRSPVKVNGVDVSDGERRKEEEKWLKRGRRKGGATRAPSREHFFKFKFEPGNYFFAGKKEYEGKEVVVVEYYPQHFFSDGDSNPHDEEDKYENMLDKTTLVTMFIDPNEYQLVKVTFENVGLEFLPGRWLVRIDELAASMTMDRPLGDVWLPDDIQVKARITTALGDISAFFQRKYYNYQRTAVKVKMEFGNISEGDDGKK